MVSELLVSLDPNKLDESLPRLNQLKTSMQEKLAILKGLDEEILTQIDEANIDEDIQQCDICREDLQLALENVEKALSTPSMPNSASASNVTENLSSNTQPASTQAPTSPQQSTASITSMTLEQNQYSSQPGKPQLCKFWGVFYVNSK